MTNLKCRECDADGGAGGRVTLVRVVDVWRGATYEGKDLPQTVDADVICIRCLRGEQTTGRVES